LKAAVFHGIKGRYVQVGIVHQPIKLDFDQILFDKEITLAGSHTQIEESIAVTKIILAIMESAKKRMPVAVEL